MATYPQEVKTAAKLMYLRRCSAKEIKETLNLNSTRVVYQWAEKGNWESLLQHETVEEAAARKLIALIEKENKTDADYKEIEKLSALMDRLAGIDIKKAKAAKEKAYANNAQQGNGKDTTKRRNKANEVGHITPNMLEGVRDKLFYAYQKRWYKNLDKRTRFILKSRQIGATFYFAWEAFEQGILTGENQVFLSASRNQADIFKAYIIKFALEYFDLKLKGSDSIELTKDGKPWAEFRFVSTNGRTAQGFHGHLYIDEVFWIPDFEKLNKVASGMAAHKKWRKTYFSTPSVKSHGAYPLWCGEKYNTNRSKKNKVDFDLSHEALKEGFEGPDKIWRNIVTVKDAEAEGCDLFDIEQLKNEYTDAEFNNLFMCAFMEAGMSVFKLDDLLSCSVDSKISWADFKANLQRPFGGRPVWIGYDPARVGDRSTVVVLGTPLRAGEKFKVLEKLELKGSFKHQASQIKNLTEKYNVQFIGVDCTGPGIGVFDEVQSFFPQVTGIHYTLESKTRLVLKGLDVIENQQIEWDAEHTDIPMAFMQIHQTTTSKDHITYESNRSNKTGHADVAWSILHALSNEPLAERKATTVEFSD